MDLKDAHALNIYFPPADLVDVHEMLQLPSERKHHETGSSLVYLVIWVRIANLF